MLFSNINLNLNAVKLNDTGHFWNIVNLAFREIYKHGNVIENNNSNKLPEFIDSKNICHLEFLCLHWLLT